MPDVLTVVTGRRARSARFAPAVLVLAAFAVALAQTIVVAALPVFSRELHVSAAGVAWLLTGFMLASAVGTPIAGRVGDLFGQRRVLVWCLGFLAVGSVLAGVSASAGSFAGVLVGRVVQGLGGGVFPMAFALARQLEPARVPKLIAVLSTVFGLGGAAGIVVAGPVTGALGATSLFWLTLAPTGVALAGSVVLPRGRFAGEARSVDLTGAAVLAVSLVALLLAISQFRAWPVPAVLGLLVLTVAGLAVFVRAENRAHTPLVELRMLRIPALRTTNLASLVVAAAMFGAVTLLPQFVQSPVRPGFGVSATTAGVAMLPVAVLMLVTGPFAARVGARRALVIGAACAAVAFAGLAFVHGHLWEVCVAGGVLGAGYGLGFAGIGTLVVDAVPPGDTGAATGLNTVLRTLGGAVGAQLTATLLAASAGESAWRLTFLVFAGLAVAGVVASSATRK